MKKLEKTIRKADVTIAKQRMELTNMKKLLKGKGIK